MKYTLCLSRPEMEVIKSVPNTVVISITDPDADQANLTDGWDDILRISFWDVDKVISSYLFSKNFPAERVDLHPATPEQIKELHSFIQLHKEKSIFVHCEAGVSRSAAVREYLRRRGWLYFGTNGFREVHPNNLILRSLERLDFPEREYTNS